MNKRLIYLIIGIGILVFLLWQFSNIAIYIIISLIITTVLKPLTNRINQIYFFSIKVPRVVGVLSSFLILIVVIGLFITLFVPLVSEQVKNIQKYIVQNEGNINIIDTESDSVEIAIEDNGFLSQLINPIDTLEGFLIANELTEYNEKGFIVDSAKETLTEFVKDINLSSLFSDILSYTGSFLVSLMAITFITFFFLFEKGLVSKNLISFIPNEYFEVSVAAFYKIEKLLSNYLLGLLFQMFAIFTIASIGLSIFGVKYALTIAIFAAVANIIPYAGPILGASFGILIGISTSSALVTSHEYFIFILKICSVFAVVQLTDNMILQPIIFSKSVKAHPLEIFIIIFVGANLAGVVGMIAAIPAYTVLRVCFVEFYKGFKKYQIFST